MAAYVTAYAAAQPLTTACYRTEEAQQRPAGGCPKLVSADDCIELPDFRCCILCLDHSTGADHRSRAFQLAPSVALSLSLSLSVRLTVCVTNATGTSVAPLLTVCTFKSACVYFKAKQLSPAGSECRLGELIAHAAAFACAHLSLHANRRHAGMSASSDSESGLEGVEQELLNLRAALGLNYRKVHDHHPTLPTALPPPAIGLQSH